MSWTRAEKAATIVWCSSSGRRRAVHVAALGGEVVAEEGGWTAALPTAAAHAALEVGAEKAVAILDLVAGGGGRRRNRPGSEENRSLGFASGRHPPLGARACSHGQPYRTSERSSI
jgi:hypothetical protein